MVYFSLCIIVTGYDLDLHLNFVYFNLCIQRRLLHRFQPLLHRFIVTGCRRLNHDPYLAYFNIGI